MCKYCKRLKELKDIDEKRHAYVVKCWKRHVYKAESIMHDVMNFIAELDSVKMPTKMHYEADYLFEQLKNFCKTDYVGR